MKSFLLRAAAFSAFLACWIAGLNNLLEPRDAKLESERVRTALRNAAELRSVCLGRSHAASLDYAELGVSGQNFALGGRDLASIEFWLRSMVPRLPQLKTVFLCISYSSLHFDNKALSPGVADARAAMYHSLPSWGFLPGDRPDFLIGKFFSFIHPDHGVSAFARSKRRGQDGGGDWADTHMAEDAIEAHGRKQAYNHSLDRQVAVHNQPDVMRASVETLERIHAFLTERRIQCILFTPPYHQSYTRHYPESDIAEMKGAMNRLRSERGIPYYDFSFVDGISTEAIHYHNSDHLNAAGKARFTRVLSERLDRDGIQLPRGP
ncbi:MAG: hypothetical protein AB7O66_12980 [Limisphaerales bacterium]